jgi:hypothetical protein
LAQARNVHSLHIYVYHPLAGGRPPSPPGLPPGSSEPLATVTGVAGNAEGHMIVDCAYTPLYDSFEAARAGSPPPLDLNGGAAPGGQ